MVNVPSIQWREWTASINPSGYITSSNAGDLATAGYVKDLSTTAGETAIFDDINISVSGQVTETKMMAAYVESWGDASGIFNMKAYFSSTSDFDSGDYKFLWNTGRHWWAEKQALDESDSSAPTTLPSNANFYSTLGSGVLNKIDALSVPESQTTEFLWLALYIGTDVPVATYGGAAENTFRFRLRFDFS